LKARIAELEKKKPGKTGSAKDMDFIDKQFQSQEENERLNKEAIVK
jgi:hypothetical protein